MLAAVTSGRSQQGVDFVDENDAWLILTSLLEELPDAFSADADKHFIEAGASAVEE